MNEWNNDEMLNKQSQPEQSTSAQTDAQAQEPISAANEPAQENTALDTDTIIEELNQENSVPVAAQQPPVAPAQPTQPAAPSEHTGGAYTAGTAAPYTPPINAGVAWNSGAAAPTSAIPPYGTGMTPPPQPPKPKKEKKKGSGSGKKIVWTVVALVVVFVIAFSGAYIGTKLAKGYAGTSENGVVVYQSDTETADDTDSTGAKVAENTVEKVASATAASVVEVKTSYVQRGSFFGDYVTSGAGSGVIISKDGYIVTNNHVIADAEEITVTLQSGKEYKAKLVGTDDKTDIAVLKIDASDLTPATFGDSSAVAVGEQIVVVGNPLGSLGGSVTTGIISAKDREIEVEKTTMTLLQIDAAVNPGNSGGALFNLKGELVGVVNAKYSSEEIEGLGFAIPINTAKSTIEDIIEYGYVKGRAQLGITAVEINDLQTAISAGVTELGVYVYNVNEGSGADKAGLQAGDRLVKIDDTEISSYAALSKVLDGHEVGDKVSVTYSRNGKQQTVDVTLIEYKPTKTEKQNKGLSNN
ncbi:MAG: trypsin-like peptidase domain-containing protein [Clostridia bacterium]|nr:trypsin-like peptidase domain-containing protein [Clostridia bacterium]